MVQEIDARGKTITHAYDAASRQTSMTDRNGRRREWSYDAADQVSTEVWKNAGGTVTQTTTYTYDGMGNITQAVNSQGTLSYTYDAVDRVQAATDTWGKTLTYTHDALGQVIRRDDPTGGIVTSVYDAVGQLTSRRFTAPSEADVRIDYTYNARGERTASSRYGDAAGTWLIGQSTFAYDAAGNETGISHLYANGTVIAKYTYTYDLARQLTSENIDGVLSSYSYNAAGEVTSDGVASYTYDAAGNRTNGNQSYDAGNRLTSDSLASYTYDDEGNLLSRTLVGGAVWNYSYDNANRLTSASKTVSGSVTYQVDYQYDAWGSRVQSSADADGSGGGSAVTERYAYDGDTQWADLNGSNVVQVHYLYGDKVDEMLARSSGGSTGWYLTDRLGTVRVVANLGGAALDRITYDGFGQVTSESMPTFGDRFKWTGREFNSDTGLQYNRARYYLNETGRWLSEDPVRWAAGDANLYRYVGNATQQLTDPSGLDGLDPGSGGSGGPGGGGGGGSGLNWNWAVLWTGGLWGGTPGTRGYRGGRDNNFDIGFVDYIPGDGGSNQDKELHGTRGGRHGGGGGFDIGFGDYIPPDGGSDQDKELHGTRGGRRGGGGGFDIGFGDYIPPDGGSDQEKELHGTRGGRRGGGGGFDIGFGDYIPPDGGSDQDKELHGTRGGRRGGGGGFDIGFGDDIPGDGGSDQEKELHSGDTGYTGGADYPSSDSSSSEQIHPRNVPSREMSELVDQSGDQAKLLAEIARLDDLRAKGRLSVDEQRLLLLLQSEVRENNGLSRRRQLDPASADSSLVRRIITGAGSLAGGALSGLAEGYGHIDRAVGDLVVGTAQAIWDPVAAIEGMIDALDEGIWMLRRNFWGTLKNTWDNLKNNPKMLAEIGVNLLAIAGPAAFKGKPKAPPSEGVPPVMGEGVPRGNPVTPVTPEPAVGPRLPNGRIPLNNVLRDVGCFPAGTMIQTPLGNQRIETLQIGDSVLTRDEENPEAPWMEGKVIDTVRRTAALWRLVVHGKEILTTGEHPFWVIGQGWVDAHSIKVGSRLRTLKGEVFVEQSEEAHEAAEVFNVTIEPSHTYFVGGDDWGFLIWSHNATATCVGGKGSSKGTARLRNSKTGQYISDPANPPSPYIMTDAQRRAHWKRLANDPKSTLTAEQRQMIRDRGNRGPQQLNEFGELETMELSHEPIPLRDGGTEVVPRWPAEHAARDPFRKLKKRD